jgi:hypothetical protein
MNKYYLSPILLIDFCDDFYGSVNILCFSKGMGLASTMGITALLIQPLTNFNLSTPQRFW